MGRRLPVIGAVVAAFMRGCAAAALMGTAAAAVAGGWPGDWFVRGFRAQAVTIEDQAFLLDGIRLTTPPDLETLPRGARSYEFTASPAPPDFEAIERLVLHPMETTYAGSRPGAMEYYWLGNVPTSVPPPPDWKRRVGQTPPWSLARATADAANLPFLNHAVFCWAGDERRGDGRSSVYLFRQGLTVERPDSVARAILRVATNARVRDAAFNEAPLHLVPLRDSALVAYDVTALLVAGTNIVALELEELPGNPEERFGVAFHLELLQRATAEPAPPRDPVAALVLGIDGDRAWGRVRELRGDGALLETPYGLYKSEWTATAGLLFPGGWRPAEPPPPWWRRWWPASPPQVPPSTRLGLPVGAMPNSLKDCLLLVAQQRTTAKPDYIQNDQLFFEGSEGRQYRLPMDQVAAIFPPQPALPPLKRPDEVTAPIYCRLETTAGEIFHGLLRAADRRRFAVETTAGPFLNVPFSRVASVRFLFHHRPLPSGAAAGPVALLPQVAGQDAFQAAFLNDARAVQDAALKIRASYVNVPPDDLADPARLDPLRYPVLVSIDPLGEYLHTLRDPGDAQQVLMRYVEQGGTLVALSRGGALRTAVRNVGGRLLRSLARPSILEQWALRIARPEEGSQPGLTPFDRPPNTTEALYFQRAAALPPGLEYLPRRIEMAPMASAPFYPMVAADGATVLYQLCDGTGFVYGPALTIVARGRGALVIVDHLLWESQSEGLTFCERVLPALLRWAILRPAR